MSGSVRRAMMGKHGREGERMDRRLRAVGLALLAAVLYAVNLPFSKLLLGQVGSLTLAGLLYLGPGYFAALPVMLLGVGLATADTLAQERGTSHPGGEAGD